VYGLEDGLRGGIVAVGGDGTVWTAGMDGLFRLSGTRWIEFGLGSFDDLRVDADGSVWAHSFGAMWQVRAP
jgi:streptogramin lyase